MNHTDKCIDLLSGRKNESKPLAQIAEMEKAQKPLTWNERINQMTAEEKRKLMTENLTACVYKKFNKSVPIGACSKKKCGDCWEEFFASPYTEGETK